MLFHLGNNDSVKAISNVDMSIAIVRLETKLKTKTEIESFNIDLQTNKKLKNSCVSISFIFLLKFYKVILFNILAYIF